MKVFSKNTIHNNINFNVAFYAFGMVNVIIIFDEILESRHKNGKHTLNQSSYKVK